MALAYPRTLGARTMRRLELALAVWAVAWLGVAAYTAYEVYALRELADTVVAAGKAIQTSGDALAAIGDLPLVGGRIGDLAGQVQVAGRQAQLGGRSSRGSATSLSILLGISIALIPTLPLLLLYLPLRSAWRRERKAIRVAVERWGPEPSLEEFLARRALEHLPYHELREVSPDPWRELGNGGRQRLAEAELRRLGIRATLPGSRS